MERSHSCPFPKPTNCRIAAVKFLIIDDNPDNRFLLTKTLLRKYPAAALVECQSIGTAVRVLKNETIDLIVAHRATEVGGAELVREVRRVNTTTPIIAVSGVNRCRETLAAGANRFQLLDEWLMVGHVAAQLLPILLAPAGMANGR
jgi:response regulator RpfG family c-di-GMP phosphodiesterase